MRQQTRYRLLEIIDRRLNDDMRAQLHGMKRIDELYQAILFAGLPAMGMLWPDSSQQELNLMAVLPGILGVVLTRLDSQGKLIAERSVGPKSAKIDQIMQDPNSGIVIDPKSPRGQGMAAVAWRSGQIQTCPSYATDSRYAYWHKVASKMGIQSTLAIPIFDSAGHVVAALSILGAYPNQFEAGWMRQFANAIQKRWSDIWQYSNSPLASNVIPQEESTVYRERLFSGGLIMYMQPVVELQTGRFSKVEALARLKLADGRIISPGVFLPLLGDYELDHVFRQGLDQVLSRLSEWDAGGLHVSASINLPPTTLLDPDCVDWIKDALDQYQIAPDRLYLELLENEDINQVAQADVINQLINLGVKLSLDDLGSGYASLKRLSSMPFDNIKIDQDLVKQLYISPLETLNLLETLINLGRHYNQQVVVEGLENEGMIEVARILHAHYGQGYGLPRPMPPEELITWANSFDLAAKPSGIHTFIGALAYHFRIIFGEKTDNILLVDSCPITQFLEDKGLATSDAAHWHSEFHARSNTKVNGSALMNWLVEQALAEGSVIGATKIT